MSVAFFLGTSKPHDPRVLVGTSCCNNGNLNLLLVHSSIQQWLITQPANVTVRVAIFYIQNLQVYWIGHLESGVVRWHAVKPGQKPQTKYNTMSEKFKYHQNCTEDSNRKTRIRFAQECAPHKQSRWSRRGVATLRVLQIRAESKLTANSIFIGTGTTGFGHIQ